MFDLRAAAKSVRKNEIPNYFIEDWGDVLRPKMKQRPSSGITAQDNRVLSELSQNRSAR